MENIPAVANNKPSINSAEFVKLTIYNDYSNTANTTVYTFSSSYSYETIDGQEYGPLGGMLAVGTQQRDMRVTSADTTVSISGIPSAGTNNIELVLDTKIRGSKLEIIRGFYDSNFELANTAHRFTGIITSYNINEERKNLEDTFSVTMNASSYKNVLQNRIAGRKTNGSSWKVYDPADTSMDNVASLADRQYDFGMPPTQVTTTTSAATAAGVGSTTSTTEFGGF